MKTDIADRFPHAAAIPYFPARNRTLMPPEFKRPALVVPLGGDYVVQSPLDRRRLPWLVELLDRNLGAHLAMLDRVKGGLGGQAFKTPDPEGVLPHFPNGFFGRSCADILAGMLRHLRPSRYVEIGSGTSTRVARYAKELHGLDTEIVSIDPAPRIPIEKVADKVIPAGLLDADPAIFGELRENDILFFDGSHLCFSGTDCARFFLEILPALPVGVYVHVHDIYLPDEYPANLEKRYYNEQHMLAAFLCGNRDFEVILPLYYLATLGHCAGNASFWMRRVAG